MNQTIQTKIIQLVDRARRERWTPAQFEKELDKLLLELGISNEVTKEKIKKELYKMLDVVNANFIGMITEAEVKSIIEYYTWKTIVTNEKFKRDLTKAFAEHIDDINYNELRNKVKLLISTQRHYEQTIIRTTIAGVDTLKTISHEAEEFVKQTGKEPRFKYMGPPPERAFCREHYKKSYTLSEIKAMTNGQGLPVLTNGGGYNCRHYWVLDV